MKKIILLLSFFYSLPFLAQNGLIKKHYNREQARQYISHDDLAIVYSEMPKLENSQYKFHIRYIKHSQIVDIYANDSINFKGQVLNHVVSQKKKKDNYISDDFVYQITDINIAYASKMGQIILQEKLYSIPTDSLIKDYNNTWNDCPGIAFEYKIGNSFSKATYNCPGFQDEENPEIVTLTKYYQSVDSILSLSSHWSGFTAKLKKGVAYWDGAMGTMYIPTDKEGWRNKKSEPERRYLKTYKDSIDNYLESLISQADFTEGQHCLGYTLEFSKKGKLKHIDIRDSDMTSKYEARQCKKKIKAIFKNSNLEHLKLEYGFERSIGLSNNGGYIYDTTYYPE